MQREGGGWTGHRYDAETWRQFDALPPAVKRLYWFAPYDYTALPAYEAMRAGEDMRAFVRGRLLGHHLDVQREALRLYGPDHPQAEGA